MGFRPTADMAATRFVAFVFVTFVYQPYSRAGLSDED